MIPPTKFSIGNFYFVEDDSLKKLFGLIRAYEMWDSVYSKKCYLFLMRSIFKLLILSYYKSNFPHENLKRKHNTCRRMFDWKINISSIASECW